MVSVFIRGYEDFIIVICRFDVYDCLNSIVILFEQIFSIDRYRGN